MKYLARMQTLESLNLPDRTISGASLRELAQPPQLQYLGFNEYGDHQVRSARRRLAPAWTASDANALAALCNRVLRRFDLDNDGRVAATEFKFAIERLGEIAPYFATNSIGNATTSLRRGTFAGHDVTVTELLIVLLRDQKLAPAALDAYPGVNDRHHNMIPGG